MFFTESPDWSRRCGAAVTEILDRFRADGLTDRTLGLIALREDGQRPVGFEHNGNWKCYPCSVVKAFHLVHLLQRLDTGTVASPADLDRAMTDMIRWSSNTATNYIIDLLTDTTGDTLLAPEAFAAWRHAREGLNRFYGTLGWEEWPGCNIALKLCGDRRYGREAQLAAEEGGYLNVLTPLASARLFHELFDGDLPLTAQARVRAQDMLHRDRLSEDADAPAYQLAGFLGGGMPPGARLWSKAGDTDWTGDPRTSYFRHDLIRIVLPSTAPVIVSIMTQGRRISENGAVIFPEIGRILSAHLLPQNSDAGFPNQSA